MDLLDLDQNRYAPPTDAALLHEQIRADLATKNALKPSKLLAQTALDECRAALMAAQTSLASAQSAYDDIVTREAELDTQVSRARGRFQSLRKVPDEILSIIFNEWLLECPRCWNCTRCDHVCMVAAAVCRWWRQVALGLPLLWREMTVRLAHVNAWNIKHWMSYMDTHRARSGRLGLHLDVSGDWLINCYNAEPELLDAFWASLKGCVGRARVFYVDSGEVTQKQDIRRLFDQDALHLVDFRIQCRPAYHGPLLRFFRSAPLLRRITLGRSLLLARDPGQSGFLAVTEAKLACTNARELRDAMLSMPNVASLHLDWCALDGSAPPGFIVHSDALRVLKWGRSRNCEEALVGCMRFPRLVVAELGFETPERVSEANLTAFLQHPLCTVQDLALDLLDLAALNGLRYTQRVTTLRFRNYTKTSEAALRGLSQPAHNAGWLCARLTKVCLPSNTEHSGIATLQDAILHFAGARGPRAALVAGWSRPQPLRSLKFKSEHRLRTLPRSLDQRIAKILNPEM